MSVSCVSCVCRCFGLFDGPKAPEKPVLGTIRARPPAMHSKRFSAQALRGALLLGESADAGPGGLGLTLEGVGEVGGVEGGRGDETAAGCVCEEEEQAEGDDTG